MLEKYRPFYEKLDSHQQIYSKPIDCYKVSKECGPPFPPSLTRHVPSDDELHDESDAELDDESNNNRDEPIKKERKKTKKICNVL